ncbi:hypothetical protein QTQ03_22380 [Micromonospora sp. WMMA1363]|uniref:hypothetical protein n=1 Tax=Micromonospora sp. WMMA1363 TaxID=3053985 RepID=UPI00259C97B8|nr:hypothetical protein [Micromonospora sp. WMMA1363]MDM4722199.1 hypothetical protein [Micromonospora sp. WMMA1363]
MRIMGKVAAVSAAVGVALAFGATPAYAKTKEYDANTWTKRQKNFFENKVLNCEKIQAKSNPRKADNCAIKFEGTFTPLPRAKQELLSGSHYNFSNDRQVAVYSIALGYSVSHNVSFNFSIKAAGNGGDGSFSIGYSKTNTHTSTETWGYNQWILPCYRGWATVAPSRANYKGTIYIEREKRRDLAVKNVDMTVESRRLADFFTYSAPISEAEKKALGQECTPVP